MYIHHYNRVTPSHWSAITEALDVQMSHWLVHTFHTKKQAFNYCELCREEKELEKKCVRLC